MAPRSLHIKGGQFIFDDGALGILLRSTDGEVGRDVQRRAYAVQKRMKRLAPVWSGELRRGIRVLSVQSQRRGPLARVASDAPHTLVAEFGREAVYARGTAGGNRGDPKVLGRNVKRLSDGGRDRDLRTGRYATALKIRLTPGGGFYYAERAGPAAGSHFMIGSIDAVVD